MSIEKVTLTEDEFAERVGLSRVTIWRLRSTGKVPHYRIGTRILYSEDHITEFLTRYERPARNAAKRDRAA